MAASAFLSWRDGGLTPDDDPALLRTVTAQEVGGGLQSPDVAKDQGHTLRLGGQIVDLVNPDQLMPTPKGSDGLSGGPAGVRLPSAVDQLMPTPRASDGEKGGPNQRGSRGDLMLPSAAAGLLGTPRTAHGIMGDIREGRDGNPRGRLEDQMGQLLPTPVAQPSGNTPEDHLAKKPGRQQVTDLAILVENDLLETGGKMLPTPTVGNATGGNASRSGDRADERLLPGLAVDFAEGKLLPTPCAAEGIKGNNSQNADRKGENGQVWLTNVAQTIREQSLLPTPITTDAKQVGPADLERDTIQLRAIEGLLPTPQAFASTRGSSQHPDKRRAGGHTINLEDVVEHQVTWGEYEPAIKRWEQVMGPAPAPTELNSKGRHRLSARFAEWMMGQPAGWITDPAIGISRNDQLKACGNGVVTQQAAAALADMLTTWDREGTVPVAVGLKVLPTTRAAQGETRNSNIYVRDPEKTQNLENVLADVINPPPVFPTPATGMMREPDIRNQLETRNTPGLESITGILGMPEDTWTHTGYRKGTDHGPHQR